MTVAAVVRPFGPAVVARFGATMPAGHRRAFEDLAACRIIAMDTSRRVTLAGTSTMSITRAGIGAVRRVTARARGRG